MSIEGILCAEQLRDYLYDRMRGARGIDDVGDEDSERPETPPAADEALTLLREIRDAIKSTTRADEATS